MPFNTSNTFLFPYFISPTFAKCRIVVALKSSAKTRYLRELPVQSVTLHNISHIHTQRRIQRISQFEDMPAKKHRSRHGNGNTVTTQSQPNPNLLQKLAVANNVNGNGTTTHNGYHQTIDEHQYKAVPINLNGTNGGGSGAYANCNGGIISSIIFTPKQQQQLDRNAFLLTLTKDQLKVECRKRGQKTTGTKTDLVHDHISISLFSPLVHYLSAFNLIGFLFNLSLNSWFLDRIALYFLLFMQIECIPSFIVARFVRVISLLWFIIWGKIENVMWHCLNLVVGRKISVPQLGSNHVIYFITRTIYSAD